MPPTAEQPDPSLVQSRSPNLSRSLLAASICSKLLSICDGENHLPEDEDALDKKFQKFSCICGVEFFLDDLADRFAAHCQTGVCAG
jgi:hypothetical protein